MILSDLASSVGEVKYGAADDNNVLSAIDLITSRVETRALGDGENPDGPLGGDGNEVAEPVEQRVFMVCNLSLRVML